jgi:hypothetical protein
MTDRIAALPVARGYPVPWFVGWLRDGEPTLRGDGEPDFRVLAPDAIKQAHRWSLCFICGQRLGRFKAFVVGPMCAVNHTSSEPPSHLDCARWSAKACPFLTRPHMNRRETGLPADVKAPDGIFLTRNPGVALIWVTTAYRLRNVPGGGILFDIGDPENVEWYAQGRKASRAEVEASLESGLPALRELAEQQGSAAVRYLERLTEQTRALLPA